MFVFDNIYSRLRTDYLCGSIFYVISLPPPPHTLTSTQHLERLNRLCSGVVERIGGRGCLVGDGDTRSLLSCRDRLLREIGRNVRLGKLLKERLADPLVPSFR